MLRTITILAAILARFEPITDTLLWIIAAILVIAGIVMLVLRRVVPGIVLIVLGLLVGPGGVSILD